MNTIEAPIHFVEKGWGHEKWFWNNEEYCGKLLFMIGGKKLSWHKHVLKDECFLCFSGAVTVVYGDSDDITTALSKELKAGDTFHVYRGLRHRLIANVDSEIIEFSTQHFDSDSIRIIPGD